MSGIIAVTWLVNAGILSPFLVLTKPQDYFYVADGVTVESCRLEMEDDTKKVYMTVLGGVFYIIASIISVTFLVCTICKARKIDLDNYFIKDDFRNHILRSIAVVTVLTVALWLPQRYIYFSNLHKTPSSDSTPTEIIDLSSVVIILSGALKPLIYIFASSQFRKAVFRALKCCNRSNREYKHTHGFKMNDRLVLPETEPL